MNGRKGQVVICFQVFPPTRWMYIFHCRESCAPKMVPNNKKCLGLGDWCLALFGISSLISLMRLKQASTYRPYCVLLDTMQTSCQNSLVYKNTSIQNRKYVLTERCYTVAFARTFSFVRVTNFYTWSPVVMTGVVLAGRESMQICVSLRIRTYKMRD